MQYTLRHRSSGAFLSCLPQNDVRCQITHYPCRNNCVVITKTPLPQPSRHLKGNGRVAQFGFLLDVFHVRRPPAFALPSVTAVLRSAAGSKSGPLVSYTLLSRLWEITIWVIRSARRQSVPGR